MSVASSPENQPGWQKLTYCWIGGARFPYPLDSTTGKKWQMMAGMGIQAHVIGFSTDLRPRRFTQHAVFHLLPGLKNALLRYIVIFLGAPLIALRLVFSRGVRVLIAQSPYEGAIGAFVKQVAGVFGRRLILIIENHGDFEDSLFLYRHIPLEGLYRALMRQSARYAFRHVDILRAVSTTTAAQLQKWAPDKPLVQFMTWTDSEAFAAGERLAPPSSNRDIVYAGVLIPLKGIHFLLDALAALAPDFPDAHLWLVGSPDNAEYVEQLKQQIHRLGLETHVTFAGRVTQQELAERMSGARVTVLPSLSEGLPRVIVEAMLCGSPVIGTAVAGIPDLIEDGVTGYLVPPGDTDALEAALRRVLAHPDIDQMGQRAREFAQAFFSPDRYFAGYRQLFEQASAFFSQKQQRGKP